MTRPSDPCKKHPPIHIYCHCLRHEETKILEDLALLAEVRKAREDYERACAEKADCALANEYEDKLLELRDKLELEE